MKHNDNGLRAIKALGQNFLIDQNITKKIAALSGADEGSGVVEIGAGLGILTAALSECAAKVVSIEIDRRLIPVLTETLSGRENVEIINADALKIDFFDICASKLNGLRPLLCANLPYNITTPLITAVLTPACFEQITVMVQREVALRIAAKAGTPDYGAFTLFVQNRADVDIVLHVPPQCFKPAPNVDSAVITLKRAPLKCAHPMFSRVVKAAFAQRRKQLVNALSAGLGISSEAVRGILTRCGIDPTARGETLSLEQFAAICEEL